MTDKPTGVFVRLHDGELSSDQKRHFQQGKYGEHPNSVRNGGVIGGLLALGTPVTGGELEVYHAPTVITGNGAECIPLVRQSDALAKLAERDAEIARKDNDIKWRDAQIESLELELSGFRAELSELVAKEVAALKGPEA